MKLYTNPVHVLSLLLSSLVTPFLCCSSGWSQWDHNQQGCDSVLINTQLCPLISSSFSHSLFFSLLSFCSFFISLSFCPFHLVSSFSLLPRTATAAAMAPRPPCWSLRTTRHSRKMRSAWLKERWSKSWPPTSRTCIWFTARPTASRPLLRAGCLAMCWAPSQSPLETLLLLAPLQQQWLMPTTSSKSHPQRPPSTSCLAFN